MKLKIRGAKKSPTKPVEKPAVPKGSKSHKHKSSDAPPVQLMVTATADKTVEIAQGIPQNRVPEIMSYPVGKRERKEIEFFDSSEPIEMSIRVPVVSHNTPELKLQDIVVDLNSSLQGKIPLGFAARKGIVTSNRRAFVYGPAMVHVPHDVRCTETELAAVRKAFLALCNAAERLGVYLAGYLIGCEGMQPEQHKEHQTKQEKAMAKRAEAMAKEKKAAKSNDATDDTIDDDEEIIVDDDAPKPKKKIKVKVRRKK